MKNVVLGITALLLSLHAYTQHDHILSPSMSVYYEQVDFVYASKNARISTLGASLNVDHSLDYEPLNWIGTHFQLGYDEYNGTYFRFGISLQARLFEDFLYVRALLPMMNMPLTSRQGYNTPFGFGANLFRGKIRLGTQVIFYRDAINPRLGIKYYFNEDI